MRSRTISGLVLVASVALLPLASCSFKPASSVYRDKLTDAGYDNVTIDRDTEKSGKKSQLVAYDFDWEVNTDSDPSTCAVELEYPAKSSGKLKGDDWHVDEVNGDDVSGWGGDSPDADTVRQLLQQHHYDC